MSDLKKDCDMRMNEYAQLLDLRAERIKVGMSFLELAVHHYKVYVDYSVSS